MAPYVELQKHIISWLLLIKQREEAFIRQMVQTFRGEGFTLNNTWEELLCLKGIRVGYHEHWSVPEAFVKIVIEQVDDSNPQEITIRNLLGFPLTHQPPVTLSQWKQHGGNHGCTLRTMRYAQPGALKVGDVLITGERVLSLPREGGNGEVLVHISGPQHEGTWLGLSARIAIALDPNY